MKVHDDCCDMFKALSAKTRVRILEALKNRGPLGAKKIAILVGVSPAAVSQHLKVLKQAGLVRSERHGYRIPYHVDVDAMHDCRAKLVQVCECGPGDACRPAGVRMTMRRKPTLRELERYKRRLEKELEAVTKRMDELARDKG